jgi:acyl-CoA thioesterase FadM
MNLWLRLLKLTILNWKTTPIAQINQSSLLSLRVYPSDLDLSFHMNNGRYLTLMDLGRLDLLFRTGLWRVIRKNRWVPIASSVAIRYRREMKLFDSFEINTRILYWDDRQFVIEQLFTLTSGSNKGQIAAKALFKGGIYSRKERKFVDTSRLMSEVNANENSPLASPEVLAFLGAESALKQ